MKHLKTTDAKSLPAVLLARADLNDMSRTLYNLARTYEAEAAEQDDDSVEGAVRGWHDSDTDDWLKERRGWLDQ